MMKTTTATKLSPTTISTTMPSMVMIIIYVWIFSLATASMTSQQLTSVADFHLDFYSLSFFIDALSRSKSMNFRSSGQRESTSNDRTFVKFSWLHLQLLLHLLHLRYLHVALIMLSCFVPSIVGLYVNNDGGDDDETTIKPTLSQQLD